MDGPSLETDALGFSSAMIASTTYISIVTGNTEPLVITLILFLSGTGPFLSWGEKYQTLLAMVAIVALAAASRNLPDHPPGPYQWLGVLIAAAIGLFSTALLRRERRGRRQAEGKLMASRTTLIAQERRRIAGQLASGIAHDLNNTLNVMKLRLAMLMLDRALPQVQRERLRQIDRAIDDSARTVSRVRDLGRMRIGPQTETAQLRDVISQAIELARPSIEGKSALCGAPIEIQFETAQPLPRVTGAASDLRQVFLNLLLNAGDAMSRGGKIGIDAHADTVTVRVADQGSGIPAEQVKRIFEPFFTTKGTRGTGLGLSIAREILEALGGCISAQNRPAGGALFTLKFPIAAAVAAEGQPITNGHIERGCRLVSGTILRRTGRTSDG